MTRDHAYAIRAMIEKASKTLDDTDALSAIELFPTYERLVELGSTVEKGFRFRYNDKLYRTEQQSTIFNGVYAPVSGTESLYSEVSMPSDGSASKPIAYNGNMELENGKYYTQDDMVFECFRDTGVPVYNKLIDLVGLYVNKK